MNKNSKPLGKQTDNKLQNLLNKIDAFLNKSGKLLNLNAVNFDYKDAEGNIVFSTDANENAKKFVNNLNRAQVVAIVENRDNGPHKDKQTTRF
ncbi:MAG: hypothetical protein LBG15_01300 [Dysgonamonadaceae bacterium]|jgi:predicted dinucleotide-utilizing enzyme|nr:hypothetical protein [Dysgonamonadaceae bacterium]